MLAAHDPSIVEWLVFKTTGFDQDAWRLCTYVRHEAHTCMCGRGSGMAALRIAVDHEAADASGSADNAPRNGDLHVCAV